MWYRFDFWQVVTFAQAALTMFLQQRKGWLELATNAHPEVATTVSVAVRLLQSKGPVNSQMSTVSHGRRKINFLLRVTMGWRVLRLETLSFDC